MIPEQSEQAKAADKAAFAAAVAKAKAADAERQRQAKAFQESRTPTAGVRAGG